MFGKSKITNPKLTEPKTFFANERTFISWLQFAGILLTIALFLFNKQDALSRWMGLALMCLTLISTFYALIRFQYRSWHLRKERSVVRYDDVTGPTCLCILLVSAMVINFYLRIVNQ
ncbi:hypothetical protein BC940DRAFT_233599 [Gongronella butleri]|nr:hypothetical protein BC940DRAFT_233599 [Gongronella butleri]